MKIIKIIIYYFFAFVLMGVFGLLIFKGINNQTVDLTEFEKHSGKVITTGVTIRESSNQKASVFYLNLEGLEQTLGVYRMNRNYQDLTDRINKNDHLTVYFLSGPSSDINIDLVQIEKAEQIILAKSEYESKESSIIWIGAIGILVVIFFSINFYYNNFKTDF